jgi:hypothetical protein
LSIHQDAGNQDEDERHHRVERVPPANSGGRAGKPDRDEAKEPGDGHGLPTVGEDARTGSTTNPILPRRDLATRAREPAVPGIDGTILAP